MKIVKQFTEDRFDNFNVVFNLRKNDKVYSIEVICKWFDNDGTILKWGGFIEKETWNSETISNKDLFEKIWMSCCENDMNIFRNNMEYVILNRKKTYATMSLIVMQDEVLKLFIHSQKNNKKEYFVRTFPSLEIEPKELIDYAQKTMKNKYANLIAHAQKIMENRYDELDNKINLLEKKSVMLVGILEAFLILWIFSIWF